MNETHGIPDARKVGMVRSEQKQGVEVIDGESEVLLSLSTESYPAGLTPEQARFIANQLLSSANRVAEGETPMSKPKARRGETIGGGYLIFRRGKTTGRVSGGNTLPFEHGSFDAARAEAETLAEHIARDIREGRFPSQSVRQRAAFVAPDGSLSADWVAMILAEDGRVEDGRIVNGPYLAVRIAEAVDRILAALREENRHLAESMVAKEREANAEIAELEFPHPLAAAKPQDTYALAKHHTGQQIASAIRARGETSETEGR